MQFMDFADTLTIYLEGDSQLTKVKEIYLFKVNNRQ